MSERPSYLPENAAQFERTEFVPDYPEGSTLPPPTVDELPILADQISQESQLHQQPTEERRAQERVRLNGRVGAAVSYRVTRSGMPINRFPLGVRDDQERTTWHAIVAFGQRAEQARDRLTRGASVEVICYEAERQTHSREGKPKTVKEDYATVIKVR